LLPLRQFELHERVGGMCSAWFARVRLGILRAAGNAFAASRMT
jgi:hypothetical protein